MSTPGDAAREQEERRRLGAVAEWYTNRSGVNGHLTILGFRAIEPHFRPGSVLEMGSADGHMTELLAARFDDVSVVEGAAEYAEAVRQRVQRAKTHVALFESFAPSERYDNVIAAHILEHVEDPVAVLRRAASWLRSGGRLFVIVPNADSLHRLVGVQMGLLRQPAEMNEQDARIGHRRVYTRDSLDADLAAAGLRILHSGGIFLKPLSNAQMEAQWNEDQIAAFGALGARFPEISAEIWSVCEPA